MRKPAGLALLAIFICLAACTEEEPQPASANATGWCKQKWLPLTGRVVDRAGLIPPDGEARLSERLADLEAANGHQFVIVTIKSLQGLEVEDYTLCLGRHWGIGRRDVDDGVIMLVAPVERKARIEVGYGLESLLRDDEAARIMREIMVPAFAAGDYAGGIARGADAIIQEIR